MVATQPLVQQNTTIASSIQPIDPGVHHIMTLLSDVNLQTELNQYGSTTETINPSMTSFSTAIDTCLHFLIPPWMVLPKSLSSLCVMLQTTPLLERSQLQYYQ